MLPEERIEKIIKDAVKANMQNAPEPDMDRIWAGIVRKARKRRAKRSAVRALGNALWYSFGTIFQGHSGTIQQSYTSDPGISPPQQPHTISPVVDNSVTDAAAKSPFKLMVPDICRLALNSTRLNIIRMGKGLPRLKWIIRPVMVGSYLPNGMPSTKEPGIPMIPMIRWSVMLPYGAIQENCSTGLKTVVTANWSGSKEN